MYEIELSEESLKLGERIAKLAPDFNILHELSPCNCGFELGKPLGHGDFCPYYQEILSNYLAIGEIVEYDKGILSDYDYLAHLMIIEHLYKYK